MDNRIGVMLENELYKLICAIYDGIEDEEEANKMVDEAIGKFSQKYSVNSEEIASRLLKIVKIQKDSDYKKRKINGLQKYIKTDKDVQEFE